MPLRLVACIVAMISQIAIGRKSIVRRVAAVTEWGRILNQSKVISRIGAPLLNVVAPPCEGICEQLVDGGIAFIGDSPVRRMCARLIARAEGLTDTETEILHWESKRISHRHYVTPAGFMQTVPKIKDAPPGTHYTLEYEKGTKRVRHCTVEFFQHEGVAQCIEEARRDNFKYIYIGFPLAHMLHFPSHNMNNLACRLGGSEFPKYIKNNFERLIHRIGNASSQHLFFGGGVPSAWGKTTCLDGNAFSPDSMGNQRPNCHTCEDCKAGACDWPHDERGLVKANALHKKLFEELARGMSHMHYFDTYRETLAAEHWPEEVHRHELCHFDNPVLDDQLDALFKKVGEGNVR